MNPSTTRKLGWMLISLCTLGAAAGMVGMVRRTLDFYASTPPPNFLFQTITLRSFNAFGKSVKITDAKTEDGHAALRIEYDGQAMLLRVHAPPAVDVPELGVYDEWAAVLAFAPMERGRVSLEPGSGNDVRLVVVNRNAAPGYDDAMGGLVNDKEWTFDIVELQHEGGMTTRRMQIPDAKGQLPSKKRDPALALEPLDERSWEYQAALVVIPKLHMPKYRFKHSAWHAMGWSLPTAGYSILGVFVGIVLVMASSVRRT